MTLVHGRELEPYDGTEHEVIEAEPDNCRSVKPAERRTTFATVYTARDDERRPIVPAWMRDRDGRRAQVRHSAGAAGWVVAWHVSRSPWHLTKTVGYTVRGVHRTIVGFTGWAFDREHKATRAEAIRALNLPEARAQYRQRKDRVRWRGPVFWIVAALTVVAGSVGWSLGTPLERVGGAVLLVAVLAFVGRPKDKPMYTPALVRAQYVRLTPDLVEGALVAAGLAKLDREGRHDIRWVDPCQRDGNGWLAVVDLPPGTTVQQAMDQRASIASGLHVAAERLWLERDKRSERRLRLWVGDVAMSEMTVPSWPLLKAGKVDVFGVFPFGLNARGRIASMTLAFTNVLVGAIPRMGKSFAARLIALAAALDPTCELHVVDLKGGGDWVMFEPVAHMLVVGDEPDDLAQIVADLRGLRAEMGRRYRMLRQMGRDKDPRAPEAKVTRELADDQALKLHPVVMAIDEVQVLFARSHDARDEAEELVTDLIKRGPAVGIILVVATQKPDKDSLPTGIRDNVGTRFGLRVLTNVASDMVLGGGMSVAGYKCHEFTRADRGVGYLVGASDHIDAEVVRSYYVDSAQAEQVIGRAWALRNDAGTLTGQAIGHTPVVRASLLVDVLEVLDGDRAHCAELAERLSTGWPDQYAGWDAARLAGALRGQGVNVGQRKVGGRNATGVLRRDLERAVRARELQD
jgi:S-DNA-T family DNA segregation ATPase FtsK/SpoIIIE